ncbi:MAG: arginine--tRNA ligase, partial [Holophagales bacterium]|nr:arginine--tRNA ligase [Holophagales bacterium]
MKALTPDSVVGSPLCELYAHLAEKVAAASEGALEPGDITLSLAPEHTGADFAFPCFPLARAWRKNPAQIASEMAARLEPDHVLDKAQGAGPYLNLSLRRSTVAARVLEQIADESAAGGAPYGASRRQVGEVVMMEYVSPNTNKPLHLGHVRNAVLGRSVAHLIESQGARVHRTDIINDRGIHIAKSMVAYRRFGEGKTPDTAGTKGDHFVGKYYVRFDKALDRERQAWLEEQGIELFRLDERAKKNAEERFLAASELRAEARSVLRLWEAEDAEVRALWRRMNGWVYDGFGQTYERLGIHFDKHYYESDIYLGGREV